MPKFFVDKNCIFDSKIILSGDDMRHIVKVLRKNIDDIIEVFDGNGNSYKVKILEINKENITTEIIEKSYQQDAKINITLFQSLPKMDKMELIIQKCTELGISKIVPFISERTVVKIDNKKTELSKLDRWRKIAQEACKQCGRAMVPEIDYICNYKDVLDKLKIYDINIFAYEKEDKLNLKSVLRENPEIKNISIIIGPEGGFSEKEVEQAIAHRAKAITLGPRILRTETAGMAILSILMYELGDMGQ